MDCCSVVLPKYAGFWKVFGGRGKTLAAGEIEGPEEEERDIVESGVYW